jgi:hypothetical protein
MARSDNNMQTRLILALAAGANAAAAAKKAGCSRRTVFRRLGEPDFRRAVAQARGQILSRATAMLARTSTLAVKTLRKLLGDANASVQRMAARSVLDSLARLASQADVEERLAALEAVAEEKEEEQS